MTLMLKLSFLDVDQGSDGTGASAQLSNPSQSWGPGYSASGQGFGGTTQGQGNGGVAQGQGHGGFAQGPGYNAAGYDQGHNGTGQPQVYGQQQPQQPQQQYSNQGTYGATPPQDQYGAVAPQGQYGATLLQPGQPEYGYGATPGQTLAAGYDRYAHPLGGQGYVGGQPTAPVNGYGGSQYGINQAPVQGAPSGGYGGAGPQGGYGGGY